MARPGVVGALALAAAVAGCGGGAGETATPVATFELPASGEMLRAGAVAATPWLEAQGLPPSLQPDAVQDDAAAVAETFIAAARQAYSGTQRQPQYASEIVAEDADRAVIVISETGLADDSVAGIQYVLLVERDGREWRMAELWTRALCLRGVSGDLCV